MIGLTFMYKMFGRSPLVIWLARSGISSIIKWPRDRVILMRGTHRQRVFEQGLAFSVKNRYQIAQIDAMVIWEMEVLKRLRDSLRSGDVVYDVGANIGLTTIPLAKVDSESNCVFYCFEPDIDNFDRLSENRRINGLDNMILHRLAVGERDAAGKLEIAEKGKSGQNRLVTDEEPLDGLAIVDVQVISLDTFATQKQRGPDVIKIDVEGGEVGVLEGMKDLLGGDRLREIFIEWHEHALNRCGKDLASCRKSIEDFGFRQMWTDRRGSTVHDHYRRA